MKNINNHVQLIGRVGKDEEVKETKKGKKYIRFSLATNSAYKNSDGELIENTDWHNCVAWGKIAENIEKYCTKGNKLLIQGKLENRDYNNDDGEKKYIIEVKLNSFLKL